jgi:hypothetical protein
MVGVVRIDEHNVLLNAAGADAPRWRAPAAARVD